MPTVSIKVEGSSSQVSLRIIDGKQRRPFVTPSPIARDDFTLRFRASTAGGEAARARLPACAHMVGDRTISRPTDGGNQGNPTHGACTGRRVGGVSQTTAPESTPPVLLLPFLLLLFPASGGGGRGRRVGARGVWFLVGALSPWKGAHRSHARRYSRSLSLSLFTSHAPPPTPLLSFPPTPMCLFVYSRVLGNTRYE